jgi:hypothetical protein
MERILPLRQRQLQRFRHWENHSPFGNADFSITWFGIRKVTRKNGIMFAKILFVPGLVSTTEDWPFQGEIVEIDHA